MADDIVTRRLALARALLLKAENLALQPEPLSSLAILAAQDAVEMILRLVCDSINAEVKERTTFLQYWDVMAAALPVTRGRWTASTGLGWPSSTMESFPRAQSARRRVGTRMSSCARPARTISMLISSKRR